MRIADSIVRGPVHVGTFVWMSGSSSGKGRDKNRFFDGFVFFKRIYCFIVDFHQYYNRYIVINFGFVVHTGVKA